MLINNYYYIILSPTGGDKDVKSSKIKVLCEMYTAYHLHPLMVNLLSPCRLGLRTEIRPHVFRCSVLRVGISLMTIRHKEALVEEFGFAQYGAFEKCHRMKDESIDESSKM